MHTSSIVTRPIRIAVAAMFRLGRPASLLLAILVQTPWNASCDELETVVIHLSVPADAPDEIKSMTPALTVRDATTRRQLFYSDVPLRTPVEIRLPHGNYEVEALIRQPRFEGFTGITVPSQGPISLVLSPPERHLLRLRLVDETGAPVAGCPVQLWFGQQNRARFPSSNSRQLEVDTGDDGVAEFTLEGKVPDGLRFGVLDRTFHLPHPARIELAQLTEHEPLQIVARRKISHGTLYLAIQTGDRVLPFHDYVAQELDGNVYLAALRLQSFENPRRHFSFVPKDGKFEINGLEDGDFLVRELEVAGQGLAKAYSPTTREGGIITVRDGRLAHDGATMLLTERDARNVAPPDVELPHAVDNRPHTEPAEALSRLEGAVTFGGEPVQGAKVELSVSAGRTVRTTADASGRFTLQHTSEPPFLVGVEHEGFTEYRFIGDDEAQRGEIDFRLHERFPARISLRIDNENIRNHSLVVILLPDGIPNAAVGIPFPEDSSMTEAFKAVGGTYQAMLETAPILSFEQREQASIAGIKPERLFYRLGEVTLDEDNNEAEVVLSADAKALTLDDIWRQLDELRLKVR